MRVGLCRPGQAWSGPAKAWSGPGHLPRAHRRIEEAFRPEASGSRGAWPEAGGSRPPRPQPYLRPARGGQENNGYIQRNETEALMVTRIQQFERELRDLMKLGPVSTEVVKMIDNFRQLDLDLK